MFHKHSLRAAAALGFTLGFLVAVPVAASEWRLALGGWDYDLQGHYNDGVRDRDFQRDLAVRPRDRASVSIDYRWREGRPDLSLAYTQIGARGRSQESVPVGIGPIPLGSVGTTVDSVSDFTDFEIAARWSLSQASWRLSPGLVLKRLAGELRITEDDVEVSRQDTEIWFPQPLLRLDGQPAPWLRFNASVQGIAYDGDRAQEWQSSAELTVGALLIQAGWQEKRYRIRDDDSDLEARLRGPVFRLGLNF